MTSIKTTAKGPAKPPVSAQNCGNCAYMRSRPNDRRSNECRWDGPPWEDKGVTASDWCRRWSPAIHAAPKPAGKSEPHDTEAKGS